MGQRLLALWSHGDDILLHRLDEDIIVEVNYVLLLILVVVHLHVDIEDLSRVLKQLAVLGDDQIKCDLHPWLHLTYAINSAHDHLIDDSVDKEVGLSRELHLHDGPDLFPHFIVERECLTELHHSLSCDLKEPLEKHVVGLKVSILISGRIRIYFLILYQVLYNIHYGRAILPGYL